MSLDEALHEASGLLRDAVTDRHAAWRVLTLATVDSGGLPDARSVILRSFDGDARSLSVHTDSRSAKAADLRAHPQVALHGWDAQRRLQVRLRGQASLHLGDAVARAAWLSLPPLARQLYRVRQLPGTKLPDPGAAWFDELPEAEAFVSFLVVVVAFDRLETLLLGDAGQVRARHEWQDAALSSCWLVP